MSTRNRLFSLAALAAAALLTSCTGPSFPKPPVGLAKLGYPEEVEASLQTSNWLTSWWSDLQTARAHRKADVAGLEEAIATEAETTSEVICQMRGTVMGGPSAEQEALEGALPQITTPPSPLPPPAPSPEEENPPARPETKDGDQLLAASMD